MDRRSILAAVTVLCMAAPAFATTFVIPDGPQNPGLTTIAQAMAAAASGDTIALQDGVFTGPGNRDVDFLGKAVLVRSLSDDPDRCIIDCEGSPAAPHRAFLLQSQEDTTSVVRGVTIRGGWVADSGGAVLTLGQDSSVLLINCVLTGNHAELAGGAVSGGEWHESGWYRSRVALRGCLLTGNTAGLGGGAVHLSYYTSPAFDDCRFVGNSAPDGGALHQNFESYGHIRRCVFQDNTATGYGGAVYSQWEENTDVEDCEFLDNTARWGGAWANPLGNSKRLAAGADKSGESFLRCAFSGNQAQRGGVAYLWGGCGQWFTDCRFTANRATEAGGVVADIYFNDARFMNCVFDRNEAPEGGVAFVTQFVDNGPSNHGTEYRSCTFWGNHAATGSVLSYRQKYPAATDALDHCLLAGNTGGDPVETNGGLGPAA
ncbi:MAG: hypothetical protein R6X35_03740, partial [Candidatus Krumholzibacteriia bacterium]